jgi:hypothetical protein
MKHDENRTNAAVATLVEQGIEWQKTYGSRSAAAFLAHRAIPRPVIQRIVDGRATRTVRAFSRTDVNLTTYGAERLPPNTMTSRTPP